jgi:Helicase conserved C-terminal domain
MVRIFAQITNHRNAKQHFIKRANHWYNHGMRSLRQCLLDTEPALLRVIAARWSLDPTGLKPRELIAQLETAIGDPARAAPMLDRLAPAEREALRSLLVAGGTLAAPNFTQRFGSIRPVGPARLEREQPWRSPVSPAEGLWYLGWLYRGFEQMPNGTMREVCFTPPELLPLLPLLKATELPAGPLSIAPTPARSRSSGDASADDLCTLISHLHNNFVRLQGRLARSSVEPTRAVLAAFLRDDDPDRIEFLLHLAYRARLLKIEAQRLRPDPKPTADWLRAASLDQLRSLFETWRADVEWNDQKHVRAFQIERAEVWRDDPAAIRTTILDALRAAVPNAWHTVQTLIAHIKSQSPDFARTDFDTGYIRAAGGEYLHGFAAWDRVEGELIRYIVTGPLFWLGIIDLSSGHDFRLSPIGAALLGMEIDQPAVPPSADRFFVQANATIDVAAARRYDRFQLARCAELISVSAEEYRYHLTPSSLGRAASQKITAVKVIEFLSRAAAQGLPPTLIKAIERWDKKGMEVKVERAVIVRVKDAAILKRLQESPKTRSLRLEVLGPTSARINEKDWPKLVSLLAESGVLVD